MDNDKEQQKEQTELELLAEFLEEPTCNQIATLGVGYAFDNNWRIVRHVFLPAYEEMINTDPEINLSVDDMVPHITTYIDDADEGIMKYGLMLTESLFKIYHCESSTGVLQSLVRQTLLEKVIDDGLSADIHYRATLALIEADKKIDDLFLEYPMLIRKVASALEEEVPDVEEGAKEAMTYLLGKI